jgi:hypothetical protein
MKGRTEAQRRKSLVFGLILNSFVLGYTFAAGIYNDGFRWWQWPIFIAVGFLVIQGRVEVGKKLGI